MTDRHAFYVGWVLGVALRHGLPFEAVTDAHGNYTDRLAMRVGSTTITVVVPPPPDDWTAADESLGVPLPPDPVSSIWGPRGGGDRP
jgi:hypothetical protein